ALDGGVGGHHEDLRALAFGRSRHVLADQVEPAQLRHHVVDHQQVEGPLGEQPLRIARAGRFDHLVAGIAQRPPERPQDLFFIVDEEDRAAVWHHGWGKSMRISVPRPGALATVSVPPSPSTMFFAIGRPRPVPPRLVVKYGSNTCERLAASIPAPVSLTTIVTPSALRRVDRVTAPPSIPAAAPAVVAAFCLRSGDAPAVSAAFARP